MEFEIIKGQKGKEHMGFNKEGFNEDSLMGEKPSDFEFLQVLGEGGQGHVYKVYSLINHKIYAMKIIDLEIKEEITEEQKKEKETIKKNIVNEIELLKKCEHPNIVKYYKSFKEKNKIYIIMEYFDNGDLDTYINVLKYLEKKNEINKDKLWNIFYQCMSGLSYLHSSNIVHRDIKPSNIFMSKNKIIKIGDFGVAALIKEQKEMERLKAMAGSLIGTKEYIAPEVYLKNYNEKIDIFSMGCVFYELYFLKKYRTNDWVKKDEHFMQVLKDNEKPIKLDNDFIKIIFDMLIKDPKERPDSKTIFNNIKEHYNKIFIQNSGLYSVIRCLINLPYFNKLLLKKSKEKELFNNKDFSKAYLFCIENKDNWIDSLTFYRHKIIEENNFLNNNKEIDLFIIVNFILEKIHGELNKVVITRLDSISNQFNEENVKQEYLKYFFSNFNSIVSSEFIGHLETFRKCKNCNVISYIFTYFFALSFDLNFPSLLKSKKTKIKLNELFNAQNKFYLDLNNIATTKCNKCNKEKEHIEKKMFYYLPYQLIIYFDRGNNNENKIKINYPQELDLSSAVLGKHSSPTKFHLTGVIKRCDINGKEHYISLIWNYSSDKKWSLFDNDKFEILNHEQDHQTGIEVMLFYTCPRKK